MGTAGNNRRVGGKRVKSPTRHRYPKIEGLKLDCRGAAERQARRQQEKEEVRQREEVRQQLGLEPEDLTQQLGALQVALVSTGDDVATAQQDTAFISDVDIDDVSAEEQAPQETVGSKTNKKKKHKPNKKKYYHANVRARQEIKDCAQYAVKADAVTESTLQQVLAYQPLPAAEELVTIAQAAYDAVKEHLAAVMEACAIGEACGRGEGQQGDAQRAAVKAKKALEKQRKQKGVASAVLTQLRQAQQLPQ